MRQAIKITFALGLVTVHASSLDEINLLIRNKQMSIYGIQEDKNTTNGVGLFYNTQNLKFKVERSDSAFKTGAMIQTNPFQNPIYVNIGGNYINERIQTTDFHSNNMNQYSGALAVGYNLHNNLYLEAGEHISKLNGSQISEDTSINSSTRKETYAQLGKRFESPIGTIDTQIKGNQIYNTLATKEKNYESSVNYYLDDAIKVGYFYSINQNEISNGYSIDLGYCSTQYTKDITQDSYNLMLGLKANFTDITKLSTYKSTSKVKKQLSKSHKFDNIILQKNMYHRK